MSIWANAIVGVGFIATMIGTFEAMVAWIIASFAGVPGLGWLLTAAFFGPTLLYLLVRFLPRTLAAERCVYRERRADERKRTAIPEPAALVGPEPGGA